MTLKVLGQEHSDVIHIRHELLQGMGQWGWQLSLGPLVKRSCIQHAKRVTAHPVVG